jgi:hypothetical protein
MDMLVDWTAISNFPTDYPRLTGWFSSAVSAGVLLTALLGYWKRPIIKVELGDKAASHGWVPLLHKNQQGEAIETPVKYLRLRITNAGLTTVKDCSGQLLKVTRRVPGNKPNYFDSERGYAFGWAHFDKSDKRDISRWQSYDIATLVFSPDGRGQLLFGGLNRSMPTTLAAFLNSYSGKATYRYDLLISADNARPRIVPLELDFDPERDSLKFIPFNTRYFGWQILRALRSLQSRRRQTP